MEKVTEPPQPPFTQLCHRVSEGHSSSGCIQTEYGNFQQSLCAALILK